MITDEKIKEEFKKWQDKAYYNEKEVSFQVEFSSLRDRINAPSYYAGFRAAERLALESFMDYLCGDADYAIIRCQKVTKDDMRKMFLAE